MNDEINQQHLKVRFETGFTFGIQLGASKNMWQIHLAFENPPLVHS